MSKSLVLTAIAALALGACAHNDTKQSAEDVKRFCAEKFADGRIDPLRDKILIPIALDQPQPIEILANRQRVTAEEKKALSALAEARLACNRFADERLGAPPAYRSASQDRITSSMSDLYAGEITYGEFARTLLFIGERDKLAREDMEKAFRERERLRDMEIWN